MCNRVWIISSPDNKEANVELKDLVGEHMLDAVDFSNEQVNTWGDEFEACSVMRFRLDGKVYMVIEEPEDGYRSSMNEITVGDWPMTNVFPPVHVIGVHRETDEGGDLVDLLDLVDAGTGKVVIEVGTDSLSDNYPAYVASFCPEAMMTNANKKPAQ